MDTPLPNRIHPIPHQGPAKGDLAAERHSGAFRLRTALEGRPRLTGGLSPFLSDFISGHLLWGSTEKKSPLGLSLLIDSGPLAIYNAR